MKVITLLTWDMPKDDEGLKKYYQYREKYGSYLEERRKKYNVKDKRWTDGTGKVYNISEFESYEDYARFSDDKEYQEIIIHFCRLVNNAEIKVLRESIRSPP